MSCIVASNTLLAHGTKRPWTEVTNVGQAKVLLWIMKVNVLLCVFCENAVISDFTSMYLISFTFCMSFVHTTKTEYIMGKVLPPPLFNLKTYSVDLNEICYHRSVFSMVQLRHISLTYNKLVSKIQHSWYQQDPYNVWYKGSINIVFPR